MKLGWVFVVLASGVLVGCSKTITWKEEVQLGDGRVIIVERETLNQPGGGEWARGGPGYHPEKRMLRVEYPAGSGRYVEWSSSKKSAEYFNPETPLLLEINGTALVVYSIIELSGGCKQYVKYAYENGSWSEEPLPDELAERPANLMLRDSVEMPELVRVEDTRKNNRDAGYSRSLKKIGPKRVSCGN